MNTRLVDPPVHLPCRALARRGIVIARADAGDAPVLRRLHQLSLATLSAGAYAPAQLRALFATRDTVPADMLASGRMRIARRHGVVVGSAGWEPRTIDGQPCAHIRSVFVHPMQARQGIASALVRAVEAHAKADGARRFTLEATLNALPLYRGLGYVAHAPTSLDLGHGLRFPVVPMSRTDAPGQPAAATETTELTGGQARGMWPSSGGRRAPAGRQPAPVAAHRRDGRCDRAPRRPGRHR